MRYALIPPLLLLTCLGGDSRTQDVPPQLISVNVDLVVLHASVRNRLGRAVSNLSEGDFAIYEAGVKQEVRLFRHDDIPVTVGLVVDHSSTMRPKLQDVIAAARMFVTASNSEDEMFVVNFNEKVTLGLAGEFRFTNRVEELESALLRAPASGQTALYDAVAAGFERLRTGHRDKKVMIVISDGGDTASSRQLNEVLKMAGHSNALLYTVGIFDADDPDRNPGVLRSLAAATGGEAFFPSEKLSVAEACEAIARDIRSQYTVGYAPSNPAKAGMYRGIRVTARTTDGEKLSVRTRSGYFVPGKAEK